MTKKDKPAIIMAYWDTTDPSNKGWSWRAIWYSRDGERQHEESGGFEGKANLSENTVVSRAKRAAGFSGSRIPVEVSY